MFIVANQHYHSNAAEIFFFFSVTQSLVLYLIL